MEDYNRSLAQAPAAVPSFVPVLQRLWGSGFGHLVEALRAKAWGTLRRHLFGFKLWLDFIHGSDIVTAGARCVQWVSFLSCIQRRHRALCSEVRGRVHGLGSVPGKLGKSGRSRLVWTGYG